MLGFFPRLAEDELLYSGIARLNRRFGRISGSRFSRLVFGSDHQRVAALFQQNVNAFIDHLPPGSNWTSDELIWEHMMTSYFSPFVDAESLEGALDKIRVGGAGGPWHLTWKTDALSSGTLRCCKECFEEDVRQFGEGTWKRVHQCPPALACPIHAIPLLETEVPLACRNRGQGKWVPLSAELVEQASPIECSAPLEVRMDLALRCRWLLENQLPPQNRSTVAQRYRTLAENGGWVGHADRLDWSTIGRELRDYYGREFLDRFSLDPTNQPRQSWIKAIAADNSRGSGPVRHLLLIAFFGVSMERFFSGDFEGVHPRRADTSTKPAPCKNAFCKRFDEQGIPWGIMRKTLIRCPECNFSYRFTVGGKYARHIEMLGDLWVRRVLELRRRGSTWGEIAREAKLSRGQLHQLKVKFQDDLVRAEAEAQAKEEMRREKEAEKRQEFRSWFQHLRERRPSATRTEISESGSGPYRWLRNHDRDWFEKHAPAAQQVDWAQRDVDLEEEVRRVAAEMLSIDPPIRVSRTQLIERSENGWCLEKRKDLVPTALKALDSLAESHADYRERVSQYQEAGGSHLESTAPEAGEA